MSVAPATLIAKKYRVERVIGEGGMGIVLAARDIELQRRVAVKLLRKDAMAPGAVARLFREARAGAAIESPHVARVLDVGRTSRGEPFLVLEHLDGEDLHVRLASGPPARTTDAVSWILQACEGLAVAHARGIVHRDLKPSNLFLARQPDGREIVKLLDFGLAKNPSEDDGRITATGAILGSPSYMSPEHLRGRTLDARSDIWSLGVTMYELLTRELPFPGRTTPEICTAVLASEPRPIGSFRNDVPIELERVIASCLAKEPSERPRDVAELAARLEPFASGAEGVSERVARALTHAAREPAALAFRDVEAPTHLVSAVDTRPREHDRSRAAVAAALTIAIVAAGAIVALRGHGETHPTPALAPEPRPPASLVPLSDSAPSPSASVETPQVASAVPRPRTLGPQKRPVHPPVRPHDPLERF